ncbi:MAG: T9SS type A sorting domain-containing protein, partial [Ignavibacteria bacterium]
QGRGDRHAVHRRLFEGVTSLGTFVVGYFTGLTDIGKYELGIPSEFKLSQNYPNPFNPSTKIRYEIPMESKVLIKIYDVLGREVSTLINEFQKAGRYQVEWNAGNLASGVYFYSIKAGDFTAVKKLVLVK